MQKHLYLAIAALFFSFTAFSISPITGALSICIGDAGNITSATPGGTWSSGNTAVATVAYGSGYSFVAGVSTGTAEITYTVGADFVTTIVTVNGAIGVITGPNELCIAATGTLNDTTSGGTWSSSNPAVVTVDSLTGSVTGVSAGYVTITYTLGSCSKTMIVTVHPIPQVFGCDNAGVGDTFMLSPDDGGILPYSMSSSDNSVALAIGGPFVVGVSPGSATINFFSPATGCGSSIDITITPVALNMPIAPIPVLCPAGSFTVIDATPGGTWSSSTPSAATISSLGVLTGVANGAAVVSYTASGATCTEPVFIHHLPDPITGPTTVCVGDTITLSSHSYQFGGDILFPGSYSVSDTNIAKQVGFEWDATERALITGKAAGVVTITFSNAEAPNCSVTTNVTVNPLPAPIAGNDFFPCPGGGTTTYTDIIAGGTWSTSDITVATIDASSGVLTPVALGAITITYTMPTGCIAIKPVTNILPTVAIIGVDFICVGATTTFSWLPGCTWSSGSPGIATVDPLTGFITGVSSGTTNIMASFGPGCSAIRTLAVNPLPAAGTITGTPMVCVGATTALADTASGGVWSSSATGTATVGSAGVVSGVLSGTVTIFYTVTTGCGIDVAAMPVTVNPLPFAGTISGPSSACEGTSTLFIDVAGGGVWSSSNTAIATVGTTGLVTGVSGGTTTISYTVSNICNTVYATQSVLINPLPIAGTISGVSAVCVGAAVLFTDPASGGAWGASNPTASVSGGVVAGVAGGTDTIMYTVTNLCGTAVASKGILVIPFPAVGPIIGAPEVCVGAAISLTDVTAMGVWSAGNASASVSGGIVTGMSAGTDTIAYAVTNVCGTTTVTKEVAINPLPDIHSISGGGNYCEGGAGMHIGLDGSEIGVNYQLYNGGSAARVPTSGTGSTLDFGLFTAPGSYTVLAGTAAGCTNTMSSMAIIMVDPLPVVYTMTGGGRYCSADPGLTLGLNGSDTGISYQLYLGASTAGSPVSGTGMPLDFGLHTVAGMYTAIATNNTTTCTNNMAGRDTITVVTTLTPVVSLSASPAAHIGVGLSDTITAAVTGGGSILAYRWYSNGALIPGATSYRYISDVFFERDSISCVVTSNVECGRSDTAHIVITLSTVGTNVLAGAGSGLQVYPNPNTGTFTVKLESRIDEQAQIIITNMVGEKVSEFRGATNKANEIKLDVAKGIYILSASTVHGRNVTKVTVE